MNKIQLTRYSSAPVAKGQQHCWAVKVVAAGQAAAPSRIFVYAKAKAGDTQGDVFQCVASVSQLQELGPLAPTIVDTDKQIPFYVSAVAEFVCRNAEEADSTWNNILEDVEDLTRNLDAADSLSVAYTVEVTATETTVVVP